MPPIGWQEMLIVAAIALIVIGPQDLPKFARMVGNIFGKVRGMAQEFQYSLQEIEHETELLKIKKQVDEQMRDIKNYNPLEETQKDVESAFGNFDNLEPAPPAPKPAEPAANGSALNGTTPAEAPTASDTKAAPKLAAKKAAAKKPAAKKATTKRKTAPKKTAAKKTTAKKTAAKKTGTKAPAHGPADA